MPRHYLSSQSSEEDYEDDYEELSDNEWFIQDLLNDYPPTSTLYVYSINTITKKFKHSTDKNHQWLYQEYFDINDTEEVFTGSSLTVDWDDFHDKAWWSKDEICPYETDWLDAYWMTQIY